MALFDGIANQAAATLLAEITFKVNLDSTTGPPPPTLYAGFRVQDGSGDFRPSATFSYDMGPANLGTTFSIPDPPANTMADLLERPESWLYTTIGFIGRDAQGFLDDLLTTGWSSGPIIRHVPRIGPGLQGYDVREITITVDDFTSIQNPQNPHMYVFGGQHTIRIYGVPEPATAWLAGAVVFVLTGCRRCWPRELR